MILHAFVVLCGFFAKLILSKNSLRNNIRVKQFDPDQDQMTKIAASMQRVKEDNYCVLPIQEIKSYHLN